MEGDSALDVGLDLVLLLGGFAGGEALRDREVDVGLFRVSLDSVEAVGVPGSEVEGGLRGASFGCEFVVEASDSVVFADLLGAILVEDADGEKSDGAAFEGGFLVELEGLS